MGNSSSASASSTPRTPKNTHGSANGSANGSLRRRSTKSVRLAAKPPPPKVQVKQTLSSQPSIGDNSANSGSLSPSPIDGDVHKSQSMYELRNGNRQLSINASASALLTYNGSTKRLSPNGISPTIDGVENDVSAIFTMSRFAQPSTSAPSALSRQKSVRRSDPTHPILPTAREICRSCFENPHNDLGNRVLSRVFEKRLDFQAFITKVGKDRWPLITNNLQNFVDEIVTNIENVDTIQRLSRKYGEEHVPLKSFGFKPDFWVSVADAIIVECVILDMATHPPTDTVTAWSQLVSLMFSSIRDGYYASLRLQRMSTRKKSLRRQESISTVDSSDNSCSKPLGPTTPEPFDSNSMHSSQTDSSHRLSPNGNARLSFQKSDSLNNKVDRPIFE
ncbi:hypothetical protein M3Y98_01109700 [Aphelenchoides besseyi]|nr:hypothetical protein M3Y98_01109700 [Aphelenchoides besseyi]KAI6209233.1 hypothetical protein M3Y96_00199600 [Aphelenchoides besseyi]